MPLSGDVSSSDLLLDCPSRWNFRTGYLPIFQNCDRINPARVVRSTGSMPGGGSRGNAHGCNKIRGLGWVRLSWVRDLYENYESFTCRRTGTEFWALRGSTSRPCGRQLEIWAASGLSFYKIWWWLTVKPRLTAKLRLTAVLRLTTWKNTVTG